MGFAWRAHMVSVILHTEGKKNRNTSGHVYYNAHQLSCWAHCKTEHSTSAESKLATMVYFIQTHVAYKRGFSCSICRIVCLRRYVLLLTFVSIARSLSARQKGKKLVNGNANWIFHLRAFLSFITNVRWIRRENKQIFFLNVDCEFNGDRTKIYTRCAHNTPAAYHFDIVRRKIAQNRTT